MLTGSLLSSLHKNKAPLDLRLFYNLQHVPKDDSASVGTGDGEERGGDRGALANACFHTCVSL